MGIGVYWRGSCVGMVFVVEIVIKNTVVIYIYKVTTNNEHENFNREYER